MVLRKVVRGESEQSFFVPIGHEGVDESRSVFFKFNPSLGRIQPLAPAIHSNAGLP